jgi:hypothetical protein
MGFLFFLCGFGFAAVDHFKFGRIAHGSVFPSVSIRLNDFNRYARLGGAASIRAVPVAAPKV